MYKLNPFLDVNNNNIPLWERGQHGGRTRPINVETLYKNTKTVCDLFDRLEIKYCLSHGTMLGVYRDKDIISWDDDVDLILFMTDIDKIRNARTELRKLGFYVVDEGDPNKPIDPKSNAPFYDFVTIKDGEKIEGWIFEKIGDYYMYDKDRSNLVMPRTMFDVLGQIEWRGNKFNTPNDIELFLTMLYGTDWKIPNKDRKPNDLKLVDDKIIVIDHKQRQTTVQKQQTIKRTLVRNIKIVNRNPIPQVNKNIKQPAQQLTPQSAKKRVNIKSILPKKVYKHKFKSS